MKAALASTSATTLAGKSARVVGVARTAASHLTARYRALQGAQVSTLVALAQVAKVCKITPIRQTFAQRTAPIITAGVDTTCMASNRTPNIPFVSPRFRLPQPACSDRHSPVSSYAELCLPATYFGVHRCRVTGKVRQIFNPDEYWEFDQHYVDYEVEYLEFHCKDAWGVPRVPNGMTWKMCAYIQRAIDERLNWRPCDGGAP